MDELNSMNIACRSLEQHTHEIYQANPPIQRSHQKSSAASAVSPDQVCDSVLIQDTQDNWVLNQFEKINLKQQGKHFIQDQIKETSIKCERDSTILNQNIVRHDTHQDKDDVRTKSGYSTEEDGTISMNTTASISSSMAAWYPTNQFRNRKRPGSDSDNNSLVVELSDDESSKQMETPSKSYYNNEYCDDDEDRSTESLVHSPLSRSYQKRAKLSNSFRNPNEIEASASTSQNNFTHNRKGRKQKWQQQQQQQESSDESATPSKLQYRHNTKCYSSSTFNRNPRTSLTRAPRLNNNFKLKAHQLTIREPHYQLNHSEQLNSTFGSIRQDFVVKYLQPMQLPIYNNIPILPTARPSMWPVAPIYIPANAHMFFALGQPHHHPHSNMHHPQQPPQIAGNSVPMSTSNVTGNVIGNHMGVASTHNTSRQCQAPIIQSELTWLRKELICPPTEIGPDGKPIKVRVKRRPLPHWMAAAVENCDSAMVELKSARHSSREQLYRTIVEEEYGFVSQD